MSLTGLDHVPPRAHRAPPSSRRPHAQADRTRRRAHLVTGATGFVGAALTLELLRATDDDVVAIVRPRAPHDATTRFREAVLEAARLYGDDHLVDQIGRCRAVAGDLLEAGCGVSEPLDAEVSQLWHSAASLQYEDRHQDNIRETNVEGTRRVVELSRRLGVGTLNYVSTAYVAGRASGPIREELAPAGEPNNHYERSKVEAEGIVAAAPVRSRILRPSIVVGHSRTLATTGATGLYGFVRQLVQFRGIMERTQQGLLQRTPIRLHLEPDATANLVPIDVVAREAVAIGRQDAAEGVYHLTNPSPPTVGSVVRTVFDLLGLAEPVFVDRAQDLEWLDAQLDKRLGFYRSYLFGDKRFERARTLAHAGEAHSPSPSVEPLVRWYIDVLERTRTGLPEAR